MSITKFNEVKVHTVSLNAFFTSSQRRTILMNTNLPHCILLNGRTFFILPIPEYVMTIATKNMIYYLSFGKSNRDAGFESVFFPTYGIQETNGLIVKFTSTRLTDWRVKLCSFHDVPQICSKLYDNFLNKFAHWFQVSCSASLGGDFWNRPDMKYLYDLALSYRWDETNHSFILLDEPYIAINARKINCTKHANSFIEANDFFQKYDALLLSRTVANVNSDLKHIDAKHTHTVCDNDIDAFTLESIKSVSKENRISFILNGHTECMNAESLFEFWKAKEIGVAFHFSGVSNQGKFYKIPTGTLGQLYIDELTKKKIVTDFKSHKHSVCTLKEARIEQMGKKRFGITGATHSKETIYRALPF